LRIFRKPGEKIQFSLKSDKLSGTLSEADRYTVHEADLCTVHEADRCTVHEADRCTVHEADRYTFCYHISLSSLRVINVSDKICSENQNTHFVFGDFI